jgi:hypothetical protein
MAHRLDGRTSATSNFLIRLRASDHEGWASGRLNFNTQFPYLLYVRTMRGSRLDGWSWIRNFHISCTRVRTKSDWRPDGDIWIVILALRRRATGRDTSSSGRLIDLSFIGTWKESETGWVLRGVRTGCWDVRTDASWIDTSRHSGGSERKCMSSGRMMLGLIGVRTVWHVVRTNGSVVRWSSGRDGSIVRTADREPKSSIFHSIQSLLRVLWIVESLFTVSLHTSDFVQNEAKILTPWIQSRTCMHYSTYYLCAYE